MKILLVEDEENISKPIVRFLQKKTFIVDAVSDGKEALSKLGVENYDLVILDLNLPEVDGITVLNKMRNELKITTPVLILTARSEIYEKIEGFDSGADDYLTKPFDILELVARVEALFRRNSSVKTKTFKLKDMEFDHELNKLNFKDKVENSLSNKESALLEYLIHNTGKVISSEELLEHVWDSNIDIFTDTVKTHVKTLRKKLRHHSDLIKTIKGKGYYIDINESA